MPTRRALLELARLTGRSPNDPVLVELFDHLVRRGHLVPFVPDWWERISWRSSEPEELANRLSNHNYPQ